MTGLAERFTARIRLRGWLAEGDALAVALSGGLDSTVLLHLLRFHPPVTDLRLLALHVDHGMRPDSAGDAAFVRGLCKAWDVELVSTRLTDPVRSEDQARAARYDILDQVRERRGLRWVLTAHHADDQAETVLFRVARGTGIRGLAGIPETREPGLLRPLLPFHRAELEAYAAENRIRFREDPSNRDPRFRRNRIRHQVIPLLEQHIAPGARKALVRLASHTRELDAALRKWAAGVEGTVEVPGETSGAAVWDRARLLELPPELQSIVIRSAFERLGQSLDEAGTRSVIEFTRVCSSGTRFRVGAVEVRREFETFVVARRAAPSADSTLILDVPGMGAGEIRLGGRLYTARWSTHARPDLTHVDSFPHDLVPFPLEIRSWRPGDRIRMTYGTKKLVKLFAEKRIGSDARRRTPLLVDGEGRVLWAPGLAKANLAATPGQGLIHVGIQAAEDAQ